MQLGSIFITGATGFWGSNFVCEVVRKYPDVRVVCLVKDKINSNQSLLFDPEIWPNLNVVFGDLLDYHSIERIVTDYEIETIVNFASVSIVRICEDNPLYALNVNVIGTGILAEIARNHKKVKHLVTISSDKAYSDSFLPYVEDVSPLKGKRPYEATKSLCDLWCQMYQYNYGVPITVVRSANLFGPGDPNMSRLIPQSCARLVKNESPFLWSDAAEYIREFVYIDDAVDFILNLIKKGHESPEIIKDCYNLGTGEIFKIKDLVNRLIKVSGKDIDIEIKDKEFSFAEIPEQYLSLKKSEEKLGWKAKFVGEQFDVALVNTYNYYYDLINR